MTFDLKECYMCFTDSGYVILKKVFNKSVEIRWLHNEGSSVVHYFSCLIFYKEHFLLNYSDIEILYKTPTHIQT